MEALLTSESTMKIRGPIYSDAVLKIAAGCEFLFVMIIVSRPTMIGVARVGLKVCYGLSSSSVELLGISIR